MSRTLYCDMVAAQALVSPHFSRIPVKGSTGSSSSCASYDMHTPRRERGRSSKNKKGTTAAATSLMSARVWCAIRMSCTRRKAKTKRGHVMRVLWRFGRRGIACLMYFYATITADATAGLSENVGRWKCRRPRANAVHYSYLTR